MCAHNLLRLAQMAGRDAAGRLACDAWCATLVARKTAEANAAADWVTTGVLADLAARPAATPSGARFDGLTALRRIHGLLMRAT